MRTMALVADNRETLNRLVALLAPLRVHISGAYIHLDIADWQEKPCDLWLIVSEQADELYAYISEVTHAPILLADSLPDKRDDSFYHTWCQNLFDKITRYFGETAAPQAAQLPATGFRDVWVVAASVGGPEAARKFFSKIRHNLPVAFIYGQHIEATAADNLLQIINRHSTLKAVRAKDRGKLEQGVVTVIPPDKLTVVDRQAELSVSCRLTWDTPYTPNLDQVIRNMGEQFPYRLGIIIMSGMCDDGARAAIHLARQGVPLWAQTPEDCISASMPESVIRSSLVSFIGTAEDLAEQLNNKYA